MQEKLGLSCPTPINIKDNKDWGKIDSSGLALSIATAAMNSTGIFVVICDSQHLSYQLEREIKVFTNLPIYNFPDLETLPYDVFSAHKDIISDRLLALNKIPNLEQGIFIVPVTTLMQRISPPSFVKQYSLHLNVGDKLDVNKFKEELVDASYISVPTVEEHGQFAVRGSILDIFPMGMDEPVRIDLFGDEIDSIRLFNPGTQLSDGTRDKIEFLPAKEYPLTKEAITLFRENWRENFSNNKSYVYKDISNGLSVGGIEYYLPLFFRETSDLFAYLPQNSTVLKIGNLEESSRQFLQSVNDRYENYRHNPDRPLLSPDKLYLKTDELFNKINKFSRCYTSNNEARIVLKPLPDLTASKSLKEPWLKLKDFIEDNIGKQRILITAETIGRLDVLLQLLEKIDLCPDVVSSWKDFLVSKKDFAICVAPLDNGFVLPECKLILIAEAVLYGNKVMQRRRRKSSDKSFENAIKHISELNIDDAVVHLKYGIGRYKGLKVLNLGKIQGEFLSLEYANEDKIYVPVSSIQLVSRYSGADLENAPLHRLGNDKWSKEKKKALEKAKDVAAELLNIYAQREAKTAFKFDFDDNSNNKFADSFEFEETSDQLNAIEHVTNDMTSVKSMDRLVCGDVGFGKTEVAMRAAFLAVQNNKQVAILVPTTLLAQQHYNTFLDRFAGWPINIACLSRFSSSTANTDTLMRLKEGKVDIIVGTHKLLQDSVKIKNLGLLIIDEEHRFGVNQKEKFRKLRAEVDILALTATPIPRTLNMALSGVRDLTIISTPPAKRLSIKTFVQEYDKHVIKEAISRELLRGGQVYFLHNSVDTIQNKAEEIRRILPEAKIEVAHGQMREKQLERVMADFYHQKFNVIICTTIIETGIDIPSANTIIIDRADKLGLAQLHQLRGRVGRSHHQAYAYLLTKEEKAISADAKKRLAAIESMEDLGSGFSLASQDLEIRGAGELLGHEQSGHIQAIGFDLYTKLLNKTIKALQAGNIDITSESIEDETEINLQLPCFIPEDYLNNVSLRLVLYKRIAGANTEEELDKIYAEMINRFGLLPDQTKNLFKVTELKLKAESLGVTKLEVTKDGGYMDFNKHTKINTENLISLIQKYSHTYKLQGMTKLKFKYKFSSIEEKFTKIEKLLDKLKPNTDK